ncbi:hypothetical protein M8818_002598 [Zalaria obscura]|uniref:Uncharacterized protein n=1 Tax=Zalaria obscura TaxID=2024903 RepID=A0ACC3SIA3_9PEZI
MPTLSKVFTRSKEAKEKEALEESAQNTQNGHSPPPSYASPPDYDPEDVAPPPDLTAGFAKLRLAPGQDTVPMPDECTAHLKLLECFYRLRQKIGSSDGLFGISNSALRPLSEEPSFKEPEFLAKLAEKRWAIYVSRAVDRFARWRDAIAPTTAYLDMSIQQDLDAMGSYVNPSAEHPSIEFNREMVPPIGESYAPPTRYKCFADFYKMCSWFGMLTCSILALTWKTASERVGCHCGTLLCHGNKLRAASTAQRSNTNRLQKRRSSSLA